MKNFLEAGKQAARWLPFSVTILLLIYAVSLNSGIPTLAEESTEVVKTATYLDSSTSLKTLINSLDRRVQYVVSETDSAMSMMVFALFIATVIAAAFWFMYLSVERQLNVLKAEAKKEEDD